MQILIIGAGVAGLTLAALLSQRGETPIVIERNDALMGQGYMLGLFPLGGRVLHGLGLYQPYLACSTTMRAYHIGTGHGELVREYSLDPVTRRFGPIQGIGRDELIDLISTRVDHSLIQTGITATAFRHLDEAVEVSFNDHSTRRFDLVVAADGLHSDTRDMILDNTGYGYRDTGWGGWVFWADAHSARLDTYAEYWGAGRFLGLYPTKQRLGVFAGGVTEEVRELGLHHLLQEMKATFHHSVPALNSAPEETADTFFWPFHDCRSKRWRKGRVVLLGDAAVGFLPTAGVGASMAMESAAALNDELSRTDGKHVEQALDLYEKRHRRRIERAQTASRQLGKWMFVNNQPIAWARNRLLKLYSVEQLVKGIAKMADEPI